MSSSPSKAPPKAGVATSSGHFCQWDGKLRTPNSKGYLVCPNCDSPDGKLEPTK